MAAAPYIRFQAGQGGVRWWSMRDIPQGTMVKSEHPIATLPEEPTKEEILQKVTDHHRFDQLRILPRFQDGVDPVIARFKSNRLRQGASIFGNRDVGAYGIFPEIVTFTSSCTPNLHVHWTGQRLELRTVQNVPPNTVLTISHDIGRILLPCRIRGASLLNTFGIVCPCGICTGNPQQRNESDRLRGLISLVVSADDDDDADPPTQFQIQAAISHLRTECLYTYRDTLWFDLYLIYRAAYCAANNAANNAVLFDQGLQALAHARALAIAYIGDQDSRVAEMQGRLQRYPDE